jgi:glycosyltransferase involved in cell wall biosynthesis
MKICLLTRYFSMQNAGIGRFSLELKKGLEKRGFSIYPVETKSKGMTGLFFHTSMGIAFKIPKNLNIYHSLTPLESIYIPKAKSVVTFHDLIPWLHSGETTSHYSGDKISGLISKYYFKYASTKAAQCAAVVCNSEQTKMEVIEHLKVPESRVLVIRLGIDPGLVPLPRKDKIFRIGTLSYLDRRKRIDVLIKAFLDADVDGELVIGGAGSDELRLKQSAGNSSKIKFLGFIPDEKLNDFYSSLDYFVFPSKIEGYGLPIIEAFACKKPVVVLNDALIPEEIKSRCVVMENLADFFRNMKMPDNLENNYAFAKEHTWDNCVEQYIKIYQSLVT